jgi:uncharacterized protein with von Willebrand factor type A (vWA) domain
VIEGMPSATGKTHAIVHDTWDKADLKRALKEERGLRRAKTRLAETNWTGPDAIDDTFFLLHKADPHLVARSAMRGSHTVNHQVLLELMASLAAQRLREHTVGNLLVAATAVIEIMPKLEAIFDRLSLAQDAADNLQKVLESLDRTDDEEIAGLYEAAAEFQLSTVDQAMAACGVDVAEDLLEAMRAATERAAKHSQVHHAWGLSPGELTRLPADERMRVAKALNSPRMMEIAGLFGRIENLALSTAAEDVDDLHDDVVDLENGADLSRVMASEFLEMCVPVMTPQFMARLASEELLQVRVRGTEDMGRGAIIMCIDGSGSMGFDDRDLWAKATMLVLLHLARSQGRQMHVINFGFRQLVHYPFVRESDFTAQRIIEAAEAFWASGTDFQAPMMKAVEILLAEFDETGRTKADVLFATDDECSVPPSFMDEYLGAMRDLRARTWGLLVDGEPEASGPLATMSEGRVFTVKDLTSGRDLRSLFAGVR